MFQHGSDLVVLPGFFGGGVVSGSLLGRCVGSCVGSLEGWGCRRHGVGVCGGEGAAYRAEKGWGEDRASGEEFHITFFQWKRVLRREV